jgi:hypothetical protein
MTGDCFPSNYPIPVKEANTPLRQLRVPLVGLQLLTRRSCAVAVWLAVLRPYIKYVSSLYDSQSSYISREFSKLLAVI